MVKIYKTLVLNKDYRPLSLFPLQVIAAREAFIRAVVNETCHVVYEYDKYIQTPLRSSNKYKWPAVIAKNDYLNIERRAILSHESLWYRDNKTCSYCGTKVKLNKNEATMEHVIPQSRGGKKDWANIVLACPTCNHNKGDKDPVGEWAPKYNHPWTPTYGQLIGIRQKFPLVIQHESWGYFIGDWKGPIIINND